MLLALHAPAQTSAPAAAKPASIDGYVNAAATGEAVRKAEVSLTRSPVSDDADELVATTDDSGHFRFANLPAGSYKLVTSKSGFLPGSYDQLTYEDAETLLRVSAGQEINQVALRLFPAASISGHVFDPDGDPAAGREVHLWSKRRSGRAEPYSPGDSTLTDRAGEYHFNEQIPGTYLVSALQAEEGRSSQTLVDAQGLPTRLRELQTFFPSALALAQAQSIHLESGQQESAVDIELRRGPVLNVTGKVTDLAGPLSEYSISGDIEEGIGWSSQAGRLLPDGEFIVERLPPGPHEITLLRQTPNGPKVAGSVQVNLADEDVSGVSISPFRPARLRVRVFMEGRDQPLAAGSVFLRAIGKDLTSRNMYYATEPHDGTFSLDGIAAGRYEIGFNGQGRAYLKSIQCGGGLLDVREIDIAEGTQLDLILTYSPHVAAVDGVVELAPDQRARLANVFVIPEERAPRDNQFPGSGIQSPDLDQYLHFSVTGLRPGKYRVFAAEESDYEVWEDDRFTKLLLPLGVELDLHEDDRRSVRLKVIRKAETEPVRRQLGL